jgi:hypothetical protein
VFREFSKQDLNVFGQVHSRECRRSDNSARQMSRGLWRWASSLEASPAD